MDADRAADPVEGGAVAASVLGLSAGLVEAIAAQADAGGAVAQAVRLRARSEALCEENRAAHRAAVEALAAPGDPGVGAQLERAAALPLAIVETAADVAELAAHVAGAAKPDARADAAVAAWLAAGAAAGAAHLVTINLAVASADPRRVAVAAALARAHGAAERAAALSG